MLRLCETTQPAFIFRKTHTRNEKYNINSKIYQGKCLGLPHARYDLENSNSTCPRSTKLALQGANAIICWKRREMVLFALIVTNDQMPRLYR